MRYRPLGMAACVLATLFPTPAPAQGCDQILTFRLWEDTPPLSLWIGERILSGRADPSCGGEEALGVRWWEKKVARAAAGCEPVKGAMEGPSSVPNVTKLKLSYLNAFCDVVAVGEVTGTEVGLYGQGDNADVYTRVRIRVTEMIRNVPRGGEVGDSLTFLVPGGSLTTSRGQHFCSELPPWARDWQPGESVLLAGRYGANDPTFVFDNFFPLQVVDGRAFAPRDFMPNAESVSLEEIRAAAGAVSPR